MTHSLNAKKTEVDGAAKQKQAELCAEMTFSFKRKLCADSDAVCTALIPWRFILFSDSMVTWKLWTTAHWPAVIRSQAPAVYEALRGDSCARCWPLAQTRAETPQSQERAVRRDI